MISPWTAKQRGVLAVLVLCGVVYWGVQSYKNPRYVSNPQPEISPRQKELRTRIDPNTAEWSTLALIPGVGQAQAKAIVAYREGFLRDNPGEVTFKQIEDLLHVKDGEDESGVRGIGPARLEALRPYLIFPGEDPAKLKE